jgi:hypothetical protein
MAYCTSTDITNVTGTTLDSTTLGALIDEADREINAYLTAKGTTGSACDAMKTASMKLTNALMILRNPIGSEGSASVMAVSLLRKAAYEILDDYLATKSSLTVPRRPYVVKVN